QPLQSVKIRSAAFSDSLNMCEVEMLCRDRHDRLWLNINGSLVYRVPVRPDGELDFHGAVVEKLPLDHPYSRKFAMHHAADGRYWMIADDPLIGVLTRKESDKAWKSIDLAKAGGSNQNLSIIESQDGIIWITGHSALHGFDGQSWRIYTSETTLLPHARLYGLFTKEKEFWLFGLASHVFRIDYGSETWHTFPEMLFQCRSPLSGDWFLRYDGIILQHHQGKWKIHHVLDTPMAAAVIRTGEVWVYGGDNGSAAAARFDGAAWQVYRFPELSACIDYRAFCERRDGSLWFGAGSDAFTDARQKGGMICFVKENGIWKPQHLAPPAVPKDVVNLAEDNEGCLWFSGWRLFRLDGNGVSPVNQPSELALPWIDAVLSDPQTGDLWISKGGTGLFQKTAAGWRLHTQADGLADNLVTAMLIDTLNHRLWAATPNGISAYDPALRQWKTTVLPPELVIGREGGTLRLTPDGRVWVNRAPRSWHKRYLQPFVEPRERIRCISYLPDRQAPETRIEMSNQRVPPSGNALISWSGEDVRRRTAGEELEFSTRLDGGPWSPFTQERQNVLIGLSPGRHTFEVRAQDRDFNIDPTPASIEFVVLPPIWRQPWFIALILAFLAVILIYEIRILRRNRRIHELDQLKLRLFTNISHELRTPLAAIRTNIEVT
ncbi:MAG: hypothetical protein ONA69_05900, partial [candidate division KSB1 bacterium]|nr:hypothetical protein [candidate division KSB1 bacterium]